MPTWLQQLFASTGARVAAGVVALLAIGGGVFFAVSGGDDGDATATDGEEEPTATEEPSNGDPEDGSAEPTDQPTPASTPTVDFELAPLPEGDGSLVSPLNGTPLDTDTRANRVLAVKIDNHVNARPQSGIEQADMMVEIWVEGITRFLSVWQDSDTDTLGPIRSMRPTDFAVLDALQATYVNSGGQGWVQAIGNATSVAWYQEPPGTFRIGSRPAPHNLYGDTGALRPLDGRGDYDRPLAPLWDFGDLAADAAPAEQIVTAWPGGFRVVWNWDGDEYRRRTQGVTHQYIDPDGDARQVTADTLVMLEMSIFTASGGSGSPVPASQTVGSGTAWVFADGMMQQGTWSRDAQTDWFTLTGQDGQEMNVPPGDLWLVLPPPGGVRPA